MYFLFQFFKSFIYFIFKKMFGHVDLGCCAGFSLVVVSRGYSLVVVSGLLMAVASLFAEQRL